MSAATEKPKPTTASGRLTKRKAKKPTVIWALLTRELVSDRANRTISAINIVEELLLPSSVFVKGEDEKVNVIDIGDPITLAFTLDWRWPEPVEAESTRVQIDWFTPSGRGFFANGGEMGNPVNRPSEVLRTHVEVRIKDLPIHEEGIYHFDILLDGKSAAKFPVRVRAAPEAPSTRVKKTSSTRNVRKLTSKSV